MNSSGQLLILISVVALTACRERQPASNSKIEAKAEAGASDPSMTNGDYVRLAAKDHALPPYIRHSAEVMARVMDGKEGDKQVVTQAIKELASTRNERTFRIWISLMLASEAGLPAVLPPLVDFAELEKQSRNDNMEAVKSNPLRFAFVLQSCVVCLTEFEMPDADREVSEFMRRFESKYGDSDAGRHFLKYYKSEINNGIEGRKTGGAAWKRGRKAPDASKE